MSELNDKTLKLYGVCEEYCKIMIDTLSKEESKKVFNFAEDCNFILDKIRWLNNWFEENKDIWYMYSNVQYVYGILNGYSLGSKKFEDSELFKTLTDYVDSMYYRIGSLIEELETK